MNPGKTIILASQSRDRKRLFSNAFIPHVVVVSEYEEIPQSNLLSKDIALLHARGKMNSVRNLIESKSILLETQFYVIVAADTVVDFEGEPIGKAKDKDHAIKMLRRLMGNTHTLITGVIIYDSESSITAEYIDSTQVTFANLSSEEIRDYVTYSDEYKWRAGSYSMFDRASVFIKSISGSPSNVIGIPMDFVYSQLKKFGINLLQFTQKKE